MYIFGWHLIFAQVSKLEADIASLFFKYLQQVGLAVI
jgi:hypothetical protein